MKKAVTWKLNQAKPISSAFVVLCLLLCTTCVFSQESQWPPAYEIKTDTSLFTPLPDGYVQILEDDKSNLTFDHVRQLAIEHKFRYSSLKKLAFFNHAYWFRYILKNVMDHDARICFPVNGEQSVYYIKSEDGQWRTYNNGHLTPWSKEDGLKWQQVVPIVIGAKQKVLVFNRVYNSNSYNFSQDSVKVGFASSYAAAQHAADSGDLYVAFTHDSILFGIMFFAVILNFFFFVVVRERVYLYFSIYLLLSGINRMGSEFHYVFLRDHRTLSDHLVLFAHAFTFTSLTIFIRSLLHTRIHLPRWDKFLTVFIIYSIIVGIASVLGIISWYPNSPLYANYITIFTYVVNDGIILLSFFFLIRIKKIERPITRLIFPAMVIWGIGWPIFILYVFFGYTLIGKILSPLWAGQWWYSIETISLTWLAIGYSWILLQRFRRLQKQVVQQALDREKEKNQLIAEQKIELEKTVEERTAEVLQQKEEIEAQRDSLQETLGELRSTQSQLIQREKMASLGELTAGIAHEIQNPLNFVNNFSEVTVELSGELKTELNKGNTDEALVIASDIEQNVQKIHHHGKRADFIVKGMLQHSRTSTGEKQPTNMNVLCEEFLKLSYHGLRAKDKSFTAETAMHFDPSLPAVNVVQQDIGRVILNLFNNAFYAVHQKAKTAGPDYKPTIEVSTAKDNGAICVIVKDNGCGIPDAIKDKIMQPFFTTKPTGEGTGLGLSLSYDIVVKGHGGSITVDTKEGEFTKFTVSIPLN